MNRRKALLGAGATVAAAGAGVVVNLSGMGTAADHAEAAARVRATLAEAPEVSELVRYATLAPNGHNTQPWRFRIAADRIDVLPDFTRRTPVVDPEDHHLYVSLGAAAETAAIAGSAVGRPAEVTFLPETDGMLRVDLGNGTPAPSPLFEAIPQRQSTRADYDGRPLEPEELAALAAAAEQPGVDVAQVTDRAAIDRIAELVIEGNTRQMTDPAFVEELRSWIRFNPRQAIARGDGLFAGGSGNPSLPDWLAGPLFGLVFRAGPENAKYAAQIGSSAGIAVFFADRDDRDHWTRVGRAFQRFALQATAMEVRTAHLNQPVEVTELRGALADAAGASGARPYLAVRFGRGPLMPYALRRPVAEVIV
jgi:nitroreductase